MRGSFKTILTAVSVAGMITVVSGVSPAFAKPPAENDDVAALKAQVAALQGKLDALEQKMGADTTAQDLDPPTRASAAYDYYDPFAMMDAMERQMRSLMGSYGVGMSPMAAGPGRSSVFSPDYDIKETEKAYVLTFDMPGMDKSKINVETKEGVLLVSGERSSESEDNQGGRVYRQQRSFGYFSRTIPLPKDVDPDTIQAKYDKGVLTVTISKKEAMQKKEETQKVQIQ